MRHLPTPLSNSFQWQAQVHMSLKHTFVAADACVATTRLIWCARAWDLTLSNSDLLGTNRLDCSTAKLKGMSTLKVLTWDSKSLNMSFFLGQRRPSDSWSTCDCWSKPRQISQRIKPCKLPTFSSDIGTYVCTQTLLWLRFGPPGVGTQQQQTVKNSSLELVLLAGVCCGPCNPSKWEAGIWGWFENGSPAALCVTLNQRPH